MDKWIRILSYINLLIGFIFFTPIRLFLTFNLFLAVGLIVSGGIYIILAEVFLDLEKIKENLKLINNDIW